MFGLGVAFQLDVFLKSLGVGLLCGLLYSCFQGLRACGLRGRIAVFLEDVLFFVSAAFLTFFFLLETDFGRVRFFLLTGEAIGFLLWELFPGQAILYLLHKCGAAVRGRRRNKKNHKVKT